MFRAYDPVTRRVHITRDVVFDEDAQWNWDDEDEGKADASDTFTVEYMVITGREEPQEEPAAAPASPPQPGGTGGVASTPVHLVSPPTELGDQLDADHDDDAPLRFRTVENILGEVTPPGQAIRNLGHGELHAVSAEEPATLADAERQPCWRKAMEEELQSIEENQTWSLAKLPKGRRAIGLKWVFKVKRDEQGKVVRHKARLVVKGYA